MSTLSPCRNNVQTQKTPCLLGAHFSIARGLHNAIYEAQSLGCNTLQIFTKNANTWKERTLTQDEIDSFNRAKEITGITSIASHTSYLVNLASHEKKKIMIKQISTD
jgi:deoxyribonuclease-4